MTLRIPPQAVEVERHVIGALLLSDPDAQVAFERVKPEDFYLEPHQNLWEGLQALAVAGLPLDCLTLTEWLRKAGKHVKSGGDAYLMEISSEVVSSANVAQHADIIREKSQLRRLIAGCGRILEQAYAAGAEVRQVLGEAESLLLSMAEERVTQGLIAWDKITPGTMRNMEIASRGELTGVPTGLTDLDAATGGLQPTDLIILAGRPAMGKTGLGLSLSWRAALKFKKRVAFFSMEMGKEQLQQRVFCAPHNLDLHQLRKGKLSQLEYDQFAATVKEMVSLPFWIDDASGKTPLQILSQCKRLKARHGLDLIVVDFCQLGKMDREMENRQQEVGEFAYALKGIAKDLHVPVVGLAQLNREVDKRSGDEMGNIAYKLSDLNESGKLEQAADIVGVIHRPEVLSKKAPQGYAQLQVIKYRNGPTGDIDIRFNKESASFSDHVPDAWAKYGEDHAGHHRASDRGPRSAPSPAHCGDPVYGQEPHRGARPGEAGWD